MLQAGRDAAADRAGPLHRRPRRRRHALGQVHLDQRVGRARSTTPAWCNVDRPRRRRDHGLVSRARSSIATVSVAVSTQPCRRTCSPSAAAQLHRRARAGEAAKPEPAAVAAGQRRRVPAPGVSRHDRRAADRRRGARVPGRHVARQARQADRRTCWPGRSSSTTGPTSGPTCCWSTARSCGRRRCGRTTTGFATRWRPTRRGTSSPASW